MCFFSLKGDEIPYSDVYVAKIIESNAEFNENSGLINNMVKVYGNSDFIYLGEDLKMYDMKTDEVIEPYGGDLYSSEKPYSYGIDVDPSFKGYVNKESIKDLKMNEKYEQEIMVSKAKLLKLNDLYNKWEKTKGKYTVILSSDKEVATKQLTEQGVDANKVRDEQEKAKIKDVQDFNQF